MTQQTESAWWSDDAATLTLWLPGDLPKSENARRHWRAKHQEQKFWDLRVKAALSRLANPPRDLTPARVRYTLRYWNHARDPTNAAASVKRPEDALVRNGVLENDTAEHVINTVEQEKVPKADTGLLVEITPIGKTEMQP